MRNLQGAFEGRAWTGDAAAAEAAGALWNVAVDPRPAAVVACRTVDEAQQAVRVAAGEGLGVSVLGGGHDWAGRAVCTGGVVLDLRALSSVELDPAARTVRVGGGALTRDLVAALPEGLVAVTGTVSSVGVAGLTLGGGYGKLNNRFGLALDTLRSADVVLADGSRARASESEDAELFWALRGGGGNFGAVTALTFEVFELASVLSSTVFVPLAALRDALRQVQALMDEAPDELSMFGVVGATPTGERGLVLAPLWTGAAAEGEAWMSRVEGVGGARVLARGWSSYRATFDEEAEKAFGKGTAFRLDAFNLPSIGGDAAERLVECAETIPSNTSWLILHGFHGAPTRVPADATAFPLRRAHFMVEVVAGWSPSNLRERDDCIAWLQGCSGRLGRAALPGGYVNILDDVERARAFYGPALERLAAVKARVDPHDLFRSNVGRFA